MSKLHNITNDIGKTIRAIQENFVFTLIKDCSQILLQGKDTEDFLQRISTNNIQGQKPGLNSLNSFVTQKGKSRARSVPEACTPSKMCIYSMLRIPSAVSPFFPLSTANLAHIDEACVQNKRTPRSVGGRPTGACGCCELLGPATSLRLLRWN